MCRITHNNNNKLRCYWVPLTVQMEESVKFPRDRNPFPAKRKAECVCVWKTRTHIQQESRNYLFCTRSVSNSNLDLLSLSKARMKGLMTYEQHSARRDI